MIVDGQPSTAVIRQFDPNLSDDEIRKLAAEHHIVVFRVPEDSIEKSVSEEEEAFCSRVAKAIAAASDNIGQRCAFILLDKKEGRDTTPANVNIVRKGMQLTAAQSVQAGTPWGQQRKEWLALHMQQQSLETRPEDLELCMALTDHTSRLRLDFYSLLSAQGEPPRYLTVTPWLRGGKNLQTELQLGNVGIAEYMKLLQEVGSAVHATHREGMAITDLKTMNVMIVDGHAVVIDVDTIRPFQPIVTMEPVGTLGHAAAEMTDPHSIQPASRRVVGPAYDGMAFGALVCECADTNVMKSEPSLNNEADILYRHPFQKQCIALALNLRHTNPLYRQDMPGALERLSLLGEQLEQSQSTEVVDMNLELNRAIHELNGIVRKRLLRDQWTDEDLACAIDAYDLCTKLYKNVGVDPLLCTQLGRLLYEKTRIASMLDEDGNASQQFEEAKAHLMEALKLRPDRCTHTAKYLERIAGEQGKKNEAKEWRDLRRHLACNPHSMEEIQESNEMIFAELEHIHPDLICFYVQNIEIPFNKQWIQEGANGTPQEETQDLPAELKKLLNGCSEECKAQLLAYWYKYICNAFHQQDKTLGNIQTVLKGTAMLRLLHEALGTPLPASVELQSARAWKDYAEFLTDHTREGSPLASLAKLCESESEKERHSMLSAKILTPEVLNDYIRSGLPIALTKTAERVEEIPPLERTASMELVLYHRAMKEGPTEAAEEHLRQASLMSSSDFNVQLAVAKHALLENTELDIPTFCRSMEKCLVMNGSEVRPLLLKHYMRLLEPSVLTQHRNLIFSLMQSWLECDGENSIKVHFAYMNACRALGESEEARRIWKKIEQNYNRLIHGEVEPPTEFPEIMQDFMHTLAEQTELQEACTHVVQILPNVVSGVTHASITLVGSAKDECSLEETTNQANQNIVDQMMTTKEVMEEGSTIYVPILNGTDLIGIISIHCSATQQHTKERCLFVAQHLGNTWGYIRQRDFRERLHMLQRKYEQTLSGKPPEIPGIHCAAKLVPKEHNVGGDFYCFTKRPNGELAIVLGDVSGHGEHSSLEATDYLRTAKGFLLNDENASHSIEQIAKTLCKHIYRAFGEWHEQIDHMATMTMLQIDIRNKTLSWANMGHDAFRIIANGKVYVGPDDRSNGSKDLPVEKAGENGLPVRAFENDHMQEWVMDLEALGTALKIRQFRLVMYTDGYPECRTKKADNSLSWEEYDRMLVKHAEPDPQQSIEAVDSEFLTLCTPEDDRTLMMIDIDLDKLEPGN
ncbi:hypothetical protein COU76_01285 [Candidatus Peregrinibacteria bacterium CG10_big_fil_rev_8_21_14_0_10_49_10]|nr:MAG: hypothetical protein COU76_01285 [Candidatus Peregrinibacteria bacterium CG10_big_fil_rev_8_21_14_0_10_49_10]